MELLDLKELEEARKVVETSRLGVRRTPCILVRGDQACEMLPNMKQAVEGWDRSDIWKSLYFRAVITFKGNQHPHQPTLTSSFCHVYHVYMANLSKIDLCLGI